jgi:hypothetical protein
VVAIEQSVALSEVGRFHVPRLRGWALIAVSAALIGGCGFAARGFGDNGLRLGSELVWRFACFIYFAAVIAGPLARLIPSQTLRRICEQRHQLVWGFCASFGIYLASVQVPSSFTLPGFKGDGASAGTTVFVAFGAALILVIAFAASRRASVFLGERARGAMLGVGMAFFWLAYALTGLAHISGPHRPDAFYGISLNLMVIALLLRFADRFAAKIRARNEPMRGPMREAA